MEDTRGKWDAIYSGRPDDVAPTPSRVLAENVHLLPPGGDALELACGLAGNAILLAGRGFRVRAWDISPVAIERVAAYAAAHRLPIEGEACDLLGHPPAPESCDVVVVTHFLERALIPHILAALRPGGLLFYQTFTREKVSEAGPGKAEFRLERNELLRMCAGLDVLVYREEGRVGDITAGFRDLAMIVARRPD